MAEQSKNHQPQDTLSNTTTTTLQATIAGSVFAAAQNALRKQNVGAMGMITRSGWLIATYAGVGATYQFTHDCAANLRAKNDTYNEAIGGFFGGATMGLWRRSVPFMLTCGVGFASVMAAFNYTKGFRGYSADAADDDNEVERREALKKMRRRSIWETIDELGEGRGIYGPGYEERRRQRLIENYGIDVVAAQAAQK
ncbi:NADH-ubiquinone oxidoreductase 213 kDa subunit [Amniculicola lignicola CBS 123094]|uniref:NADH-ubiquinone oxidoreductase 213 kDa subunit n=1 Tax=Amniculicola lignicola CBS 123094 TaxID=1392246 RepID=A0A6A5X4V2_9PLEO|nr:NADH-ubiquinone oxidoreductase 213 kDa subunit [Amniculicola lignicola CBS 123094]